jgi:hypothetical protein
MLGIGRARRPPSSSAVTIMKRNTLLMALSVSALLGGLLATLAAGLVPIRGSQPVRALSAVADDSFAACTARVDSGIEGFFMLDFQTGDLTGGVLNPVMQKFSVGYRHNVLKDLNFKAGKVKNARFLLVPGEMAFAGQAAGSLAASVLYVTDAATGMTVAYGIPWGAGAAGLQNPLVPLDRANARGGGDKVQ